MEIGLLGPFELRVGGQAVPLASRRLRCLLAALALSAGRPVPVDVLADRIWGEELPAQIRGALATYVLRLRRVLGDDTIATRPDGYALLVDPSQVDALRFLNLVDDAASVDDAHAEHALLTEALDLWRGPALAGLSQVLEAEETPRLTERRLLSWERRIDLDLASGRAGGVIAELRTLTARHPLRESLWVRLITALRALDRGAEALESYEACRTELADELGTDPGRELQQLYHELLDSARAGMRTERGSGASGEPDRGAPERPEPAEPPLRTEPPDPGEPPTTDLPEPPEPPRQLPPRSPRFIGRTEELRHLDQLLSGLGSGQATTLLVTIDGPAGVGKTALAVHWAHRVAEGFDGQLYADLHGYSAGQPVDPSAVLVAFLRTLGVAPDRIPAGRDERAALLRTRLAGQRMLILLDNARSAGQVRPLLPGAGCLVVVTSRNQLRGLAVRDAAQRVSLQPLPAGDAAALLATATGRAAFGDGEVAVRELVELCGRIPLAVLIAAERVSRSPDASVAALVAELRDRARRLDTLGDEDDPANDLRRVFSWTYDALEEPVRTMFRRLGQHRPGQISVPAAAAIADTDADQAARLLDRLAAVHLVEPGRTGAYKLHDLVHAFAAELSERHDSDTARCEAARRVFDWYLFATAAAAAKLRPEVRGLVVDPGAAPAPALTFDDYDAALRWFEAERDTLTAAVQCAHDYGWHEHAWKQAWLLSTFLELRSHRDEWLATARAGHESGRRLDDLTAVHRSANNLGRVYGTLRRFVESAAVLEEALTACRAIGDASGESVVLGNLGVNAWERGDYAASIRYHQLSLEASDRASRPEGRATALYNLATTYAQLESYDEALAYAREALDVFESVDAPRRQANALANLAEILALRGDNAAAVSHGERALVRLRGLRDDFATADLLTALGGAHLALGDELAAEASWTEALAVFTRIRHRRAHEVGELLRDLRKADERSA